MVDACNAGEHDLAAALQLRLGPAATDIAGAMGPAGIKAAMDMVGLKGGEPRRPLLSVVGEELETVRARLGSAGLLLS